MYRSSLRYALSIACALAMLHCGSDPVQNGTPAQPLPFPGSTGGPADANDELALNANAELNGRYVKGVRIDGDSFSASAPGQDVEITFTATGLNNVKQFEVRLRIEPEAAFDLAASSFAPLQPFISPPTSVERTEDGLWRTGGASVTRVVEGDATFGTLKLKTASGFDSDTQVRVQVDYFSIGPSFSDRDDYNANDLQMGVIVNK